jgi:hypothetical protein
MIRNDGLTKTPTRKATLLVKDEPDAVMSSGGGGRGTHASFVRIRKGTPTPKKVRFDSERKEDSNGSVHSLTPSTSLSASSQKEDDARLIEGVDHSPVQSSTKKPIITQILPGKLRAVASRGARTVPPNAPSSTKVATFRFGDASSDLPGLKKEPVVRGGGDDLSTQEVECFLASMGHDPLRYITTQEGPHIWDDMKDYSPSAKRKKPRLFEEDKKPSPVKSKQDMSPVNDSADAADLPPSFPFGKIIMTTQGPAVLLQGDAASSVAASSNPSSANKRWTKQEDKILLEAVKKEGGPPYNWREISTTYFFGTRSARQVRTLFLQQGCL